MSPRRTAAVLATVLIGAVMGALTQENDGQVTLVYAGSPGAYEDYADVLAETEAAMCVLDEIDAPKSVLARLGNTRALDGMQDARWGDYAASWTYHPDDGLNLIITEG